MDAVVDQSWISTVHCDQAILVALEANMTRKLVPLIHGWKSGRLPRILVRVRVGSCWYIDMLGSLGGKGEGVRNFIEVLLEGPIDSSIAKFQCQNCH